MVQGDVPGLVEDAVQLGFLPQDVDRYTVQIVQIVQIVQLVQIVQIHSTHRC